jgi:Uma2 family endonuclease
MATVPKRRVPRREEYRSGDGKPMAETPTHRQNLNDLIAMLMAWFGGDPLAYVSGNMFVYYVRGDKRRHISPDVFVVRGIDKNRRRDVYLVWEEGKGPQVVIELTSRSTRREDLVTKFERYRDVLKLQEYYLFDPFGEYLTPQLRGFRLIRSAYVPIQPIEGRLPSKVLNLHLEAAGSMLRLYDPAAGEWLLTPAEEVERAHAENARLRQEIAALRRQLPLMP